MDLTETGCEVVGSG